VVLAIISASVTVRVENCMGTTLGDQEDEEEK
jgi:hypothetical protein